MRDAGPQGRKERRAGRNRDLAGRSAHLTEAILRVAGAILADAFAFAIWNLATRSPVRLARDIAGGFTKPAILVRGILHFVCGSLLLVGGASLLVPLVIQSHTFFILETWTVVTALLVEQIIGADLQALATGTRR